MWLLYKAATAQCVLVQDEMGKALVRFIIQNYIHVNTNAGHKTAAQVFTSKSMSAKQLQAWMILLYYF